MQYHECLSLDHVRVFPSSDWLGPAQCSSVVTEILKKRGQFLSNAWKQNSPASRSSGGI